MSENKEKLIGLITENVSNADLALDLKNKIEPLLENVILTCEILEELGEKTTQENVRSALGGGSYGTIGPMLKKLKSEKLKNNELAEIEIPDSVELRAKTLLGEVWQSAIDEADSRLNLQREELKAAQDEAQAEIDEATGAIKTLEDEAKNYIELISQKETENNDKNSRIENLEGELTALASEKKVIDEKLLNESLNLSKSEALAKDAKSDFDAERKINKKLNDEKIAKIEEFNALTQRSAADINDLKLEKVEMANEITKLQKEAEGLLNENTTLAKGNGVLQKENNRFNLQANKLQSSLDASTEAHQESKDQIVKLNGSLTDAVKINGANEARLEATEAENKNLRTEIQELKKLPPNTKNKSPQSS